MAVEDDEILGFATVAPAHFEIDQLSAVARKKLPRYPLPVLRLARLAVDRATRGGGVGGHLLRFVLKMAMRMSEEFGYVGVAVDAKPNAIAFYERYGFVRVDASDELSNARSHSTQMFLSITAIKEAVGN